MYKIIAALSLFVAATLLSGFGVGVDGGQSGCWRPGSDGWIVECTKTGTGSCTTGSYTGTCIIYVSNAGNDSTCTPLPPPLTDTPANSCLHLGAASALIRDNSTDQLRLKRGDTWTNSDYGDVSQLDYFGQSNNRGFWCSHRGTISNFPVVIGAYGTSTSRPLFNVSRITNTTTQGNSVFWGRAQPGDPCDLRDTAIIGIEFSNYRTDPLNGAFSQTALDNGFIFVNEGPLYVNGPGTLIMQDLKLYNLESVINNFQHFYLIRNTIYQGTGIGWQASNAGQQYSPLDGSTTGGYDMSGPSFYIEGNFFWHNGWREDVTCTGGCTRGVFTHNLYVQYSEGNGTQPMLMTMKNNVSISGSDVGLRSRGGGLIDNNLSVQDASGIDYGSGNTTRNSFCPTLGAWETAACPNPPPAPGVNAITNNTIMASQSTQSTGGTACNRGMGIAGIQQTLTISNNLIAHIDPAISNCTGIILSPPDAAAVTVSGNTICDYPTTAVSNTGTGSGSNTVGTNVTQASCTGTGPNPTRTVATYDTDVLGGPGTLQDFINQRLAMNKQNWNTNLTAPALNNYFRTGYGLTAYP